LYSSTNIITFIRFEDKRDKWHGGRKKERFTGGKGMDGRTVLQYILKQQGGKVWTGFIFLTMRTCGGFS